MRHHALMLVLLLPACGTSLSYAVPAEDWQPRSPELQELSRSFAEVSRNVGDAAQTECQRRSSTVNCDFAIMVDVDPRVQANAFQTLDAEGRPVIIFSQAMIRSTQNADELAFVMGHEAAHHILDHISRQAENAKQGAREFGELARKRGESSAGIEKAQELGAEVGVQSYSQDFELEADVLGTLITHRSGYNPLIGLKFFQRIPDPGDQFLATHPPNAQRVEAVMLTAAQLGLTQ